MPASDASTVPAAISTLAASIRRGPFRLATRHAESAAPPTTASAPNEFSTATATTAGPLMTRVPPRHRRRERGSVDRRGKDQPQADRTGQDDNRRHSVRRPARRKEVNRAEAQVCRHEEGATDVIQPEETTLRPSVIKITKDAAAVPPRSREKPQTSWCGLRRAANWRRRIAENEKAMAATAMG